jgi:hypothetical protein
MMDKIKIIIRGRPVEINGKLNNDTGILFSSRHVIPEKICSLFEEIQILLTMKIFRRNIKI